MPHHHDHSSEHSHKHSHGHDDHGHAHAGGHHHGNPTDHGRAFVIAIVLNSLFVIIEFGYGFIANSTALMADAGHNLSDVLGLALAWGAAILARKAPNEKFTYGLRSSSILAALANAMFLLVACGAIAFEAIIRFSQPPVIASMTVTVVATIGIIINGVSAWLFMNGSKDDLNIRGAYLHMAADAAISLGVALTGIVMLFTAWYWLDPVVSLLIVAVIIAGTWGLLRDSVKLALNAVPSHINVTDVDNYLRSCEGVASIHDLHIWAMSTTESALTVHLVIPAGYPGDDFIDEITHTLKDKFNIQHSTLQVEQGTTNHSCGLHTHS